MKIKTIVIELGDGTEIELEIDAARELYPELGQLFAPASHEETDEPAYPTNPTQKSKVKKTTMRLRRQAGGIV